MCIERCPHGSGGSGSEGGCLPHDLDVAVAKLRLLKSSHQSQIYSLESDIISRYPKRISEYTQNAEGYKEDITRRDENTHPDEDGFSPMVLEDKTYTDKKAAGSALLEICHNMKSPDPVPLGQYRGFRMELEFDRFNKVFSISMYGARRYSVGLGTDIFGNIQRLDNALSSLETWVQQAEHVVEETKKQLEAAKIEAQRPFPQEDELNEKQARLNQLNIELNMDQHDNVVLDDDRDEGAEKTHSDVERER